MREGRRSARQGRAGRATRDIGSVGLTRARAAVLCCAVLCVAPGGAACAQHVCPSPRKKCARAHRHPVRHSATGTRPSARQRGAARRGAAGGEACARESSRSGFPEWAERRLPIQLSVRACARGASVSVKRAHLANHFHLRSRSVRMMGTASSSLRLCATMSCSSVSRAPEPSIVVKASAFEPLVGRTIPSNE